MILGVIMQTGSATGALTITPIQKSGNNIPVKTTATGNNLPLSKVQNSEPKQEVSTIRSLAQHINPSSMTRNDAATLSAALFPDDPSAAFSAQALILVSENGRLRPATPNDAIMNEKFDMFESIKGQMEFNQQHGISNDGLKAAQDFLHKLEAAKTTPSVDTYT